MVFMKRHRRMLIAAAFGAFLFVGITLAIKFGSDRWGAGAGNETLPNLFLALSIVISAPAAALNDAVIGVSRSDIDSWVNSEAFVVIVNGILGATIFSVLSVVWQFMRGHKD